MGTRHDRYSQSVTDWLETRGVNMPGLFTGEIPLARVEEEGWGQDLLGKDIHIGRVREIDPSQALKPSDVAAAEVWDSPTFWELAMDEGLPTTLKTGEGYGYLDEGDAEGEGVIAGTRTLRLTAMALGSRRVFSRFPDPSLRVRGADLKTAAGGCKNSCWVLDLSRMTIGDLGHKIGSSADHGWRSDDPPGSDLTGGIGQWILMRSQDRHTKSIIHGLVCQGGSRGDLRARDHAPVCQHTPWLPLSAYGV
jgi:hypothetical protein